MFNHGASTIDCVVRDISETGVRLEVPVSVALPTEFDLRIPHRNKTFKVALARRSGSILGGKFIGAPSAPASSPETSSAGDGQTISRIERENVRLRARVRELTRRLEDLGQDVTSVEGGW
jgi:hypothetical protein